MTAGPDTFTPQTFSRGVTPGSPDVDSYVNDLLTGERSYRQPNGPALTAEESRPEPIEQAIDPTATAEEITQAVPAEAAVTTPQPVQPVTEPDTSRERYAEHPRSYRPRRNIIRTRHVAWAALGFVVVYAGVHAVNDIENFFKGFGQAFAGQEDVKRESNAALGRITIPGDTIAVDGYGQSVTTLGVGYQCPSVIRMVCDAVPRAHNGVIPYVDAKATMTGDDQTIIPPDAWHFSSQVDEKGTPHTVVAVEADKIHAQWANDIVTTQTHNYLSENMVDTANLKTGVDQISNSTVATSKDVFLQTCRDPLYAALPAGIAHTVQGWEQNLADGLTNPEDAVTKKRLQQMAGTTVIIKFIGSELNLNGPQVVPNGTINEAGLQFNETVTKECHLSKQAEQDLKDYKNQNGKTYEVAQTVPLATGPRIDTEHPIAVG